MDGSAGFHDTLARATLKGKETFHKLHAKKIAGAPTKNDLKIKENEVKRLREIDEKCQSILHYFQNLQVFFIIGATVFTFSAVVVFGSGDEVLSLALGLPLLGGGVVMIELIIEVDALKDGIELYRKMQTGIIEALENGPKCIFRNNGDNVRVTEDTWTVQYKNVEYKLDQAHILEMIHRKRLHDLFLTQSEVAQFQQNFSC